MDIWARIKQVTVASLLLSLLLRIGPIPEQVPGTEVVHRQAWDSTPYIAKDGSFEVFFFAGCFPGGNKCQLNEMTDWEVGAK